MTATRQRRLQERARRSVSSNPGLCLESIEQLLRNGAADREFLVLRANALRNLGQYSQAGVLYRQLFEQNPGDHSLALESISCFLRCFDYTAIKDLLPDLVESPPKSEKGLVVCIRAAQALRQSSLALQLCEKLVEKAPGDPVHRCKLGTLYQSFGQMGQAEEEFLAALEIDIDYEPAWYFLAQLRKYSSDDNHLAELYYFLERQSQNGTGASAVHYAIAKECEDLGRYDDAFEHMNKGAQQMRRRSGYGVEADQRLFKELQDWFAGSNPMDTTLPQPEGPVFVLGMPRTGSTLADRILSSHSEVSSVGELMCFRRAVEELCASGGHQDFFSHFFAQAPRQLPYHEIGARYLDMVSPLHGEQRYFIDKMPMNYVFAGLIARALPGARFIHTIRNPMDTCFSNFKQMFGEGYYGYSYDLESTAVHYKLYRDLMAFWHQHLPGRIYDLEYERMVADPEGESRAMLSWLGLDWQERCLQFHRSSTAVHTASVSQVRQPIYRDSVEKWRKFGHHLQPLQQALESVSQAS